MSAPSADRQRIRLLRRPRLGDARAADRRRDRRADRRLPRRADDAHPRPRPAEGPRARLRQDLPAPARVHARGRRSTGASRSSPTPAGSTRPGSPPRSAPSPTTSDCDVAVAHVEGDDLRARAGELGLGEPLAANAYLGAWGIADCLDVGADVVVTGRVTDASLVVGPAAAHFGWSRTSYDELAGAVVAGHVIECGPQASGGNYAFFGELPALDKPLGFPIAEVYADGSSVITKHPGTGGAVTVGTVTAQLLYEIGGAALRRARRHRPLRHDHADRRRRRPRPHQRRARRAAAVDAEGRAEHARRVPQRGDVRPHRPRHRGQGRPGCSRSSSSLDATWTLARTDHPDAAVQEEAAALLHCVVRGTDPKALGRAFSGAAIELALASYPGFHVTAPPGEASPYGVFSAAYVAGGRRAARRRARRTGRGSTSRRRPTTLRRSRRWTSRAWTRSSASAGATRAVPLGLVAGARSGDKGGVGQRRRVGAYATRRSAGSRPT